MEPNHVHQPEQLVKEFFDMVELPSPDHHFATLPYIKGIIEPLTKILRRYDIKVTNKPMQTLEQQFPSLKHRVPLEQTTNNLQNTMPGLSLELYRRNGEVS